MAKDTTASEAIESASLKASTSEAGADTLTLDEYLSQNKVNPGLVASFKWEALQNGDLLKPKTSQGWEAELKFQANRTYQ